MRNPSIALLIIMLLCALIATPAWPKVAGVLKITRSYGYAEQDVPAYITREHSPARNPVTEEGATLGRVLFYDQRLSADHSLSCASCHRQEHAFSDIAPLSEGIDGQPTSRHSMRLVNLRFGDDPRVRWDESAATLEDQMLLPIRSAVEMGFSGENGAPGLDDLIDRMQETRYYPTLFRRAFGDPTITDERIALALAQFLRSIQSFDSKYDRGRERVASDLEDFPNFTRSENNGKRLFMEDFNWVRDQITLPENRRAGGGTFEAARRISGGMNCAACHVPPEFAIVPDSLNNGFVRGASRSPRGTVEVGVTRSPTLRDLINPNGELNGGMFHRGQAENINLLFAHYDFRRPDERNTNLDPRMTKGGLPQWLDASREERRDLIAFLKTLTGRDLYTDERWSDPFDDEGNLRIRR